MFVPASETRFRPMSNVTADGLRHEELGHDASPGVPAKVGAGPSPERRDAEAKLHAGCVEGLAPAGAGIVRASKDMGFRAF